MLRKGTVKVVTGESFEGFIDRENKGDTVLWHVYRSRGGVSEEVGVKTINNTDVEVEDVLTERHKGRLYSQQDKLERILGKYGKRLKDEHPELFEEEER